MECGLYPFPLTLITKDLLISTSDSIYWHWFWVRSFDIGQDDSGALLPVHVNEKFKN